MTNKIKTTSYEISKKLAEIGFKSTFYFGYHFELRALHSETIRNRSDALYYPAYDLETIIGALPAFIDKYGEHDESFDFWMWNDGLGYYPHEDGCSINGDVYFMSQAAFEVVSDIQDKSLADTAARLLIKLHEEGLIKFGDSYDN